MQEKLVEFNTAVLAKEKGFDEYCFSFYDLKGIINHNYSENGSSTDVEFRVDLEDLLDNFNRGIPNTYSAPTQSLLAKWLREVHNIFVYVEPTSLGDNAPFIKDSWGKVYHDPWKNNNKGISYEYEDAIEFALLEALKLIKNE